MLLRPGNKHAEEEKRRVSFKPNFRSNKSGNKKYNKDWSSSLRAHLEDEDVDMGQDVGSSTNQSKWKKSNRNGKFHKRMGSPAPSGRRKLIEGQGGGWYKVTVSILPKYSVKIKPN